MYKHFFKRVQDICLVLVALECIRFQSLFVADNIQERRAA